MKKIYSTLAALGLAATMQAQVIMNVEQPPGLQGSYSVAWAGTDWGIPDMTDPANSVTDTLAIVDDGTADDSLGCNALVNGADITGKIAVVYRGTCEFGVKALNAQDAGAVGVIIINNQGSPITPGAGASGALVTIPVVMISTNDGALLHDEIAAGNVVAFIGSIIGLYSNDVGYFDDNVIVPSHSALPKLVAQNSSEYSTPLGMWMFNYGTSNQTGVVVNADVQQGGNSVYSQSSAPIDILSGDSVFVDLGDFSQATYDGYYTLTYTATLNGVTEDFPSNNTESASMYFGEIIAYSPVDEITGLPIVSGSVLPGGNTTGFTLCNFFQDPNASRLGVTGLHFSLTPVVTATDITGTLVNVDAFEITDVFTGLSDFPADPTLDIVATKEYTLTGNTPSVNLFAPFDQAFALADNVPYLFCITTFSADVRIGYNDLLDYTEYQDTTDNLVTTVQDPTGFFEGGFEGGGASSIAIQTIPAGAIGLEETLNQVNIASYPNPSSDMVNIPMVGFSGMADLRVVDVDGKLVKQQRVNVGNGTLVVNVSDVAAGTYTFNMNFADGRTSAFRVVVSK
ncbi:MAG: T9SS type A sorting domain-containing protein [Flavobacteriales bacterium]|nr:T9SS type A sorting domain-containing protein [Flavobacteriales bacterium]